MFQHMPVHSAERRQEQPRSSVLHAGYYTLSQCSAAPKVRDSSHKSSLKGRSGQGIGNTQTTKQLYSP